MRLHLRRAPLVAAATLGLTLAAAPPATAADYREFCSYDAVSDYGAVTMYACIAAAIPNEGYPTVRPFAKITWRNVNPLNWKSCTVRVALFVDDVQRRIESFDCLYDARRGTQLAPVTAQYSGATATANTDDTYHAVTEWYGVYGTTTVKSHTQAHSPDVWFDVLCDPC